MKDHHHHGPVAPTANSPSEIHESIATRAYERWEKQGKPEGQADRFWLEAEQELIAERTAKKE